MWREIDEATYIIHGIATKLLIENHLRSHSMPLHRLLQFFLRNHSKSTAESLIT